MKKLLLLFLVLCGGVTQMQADTYQVAGDAGLFGDSWTEHSLTDSDGDGIYTYTDTRSITAGTYQYKFKTNNEYWGGENKTITFQKTGKYKIVFTLNTIGFATDGYAFLKPTTVTFVGKGITSDEWASTEADFTADGDSWTFTIDETTDNNIYFRFKVDGTEYQPSSTEDLWFKRNTSWTKNMNTWSSYEGTSKCFAMESFNYVNFNRYVVRITPYHNNMYLEVLAYEKVRTNSDGYCTFKNSYPLTISGATAYYATDNNNGRATAHAITNPDSNTPMLIKGDASHDYYFLTASTGTNYSSTNAFQAGDGSAVESNPVAGQYNYILNGATFKAAAGKKVATGKAYLQLSQAATGASRILIFEDETTGINVVMTEENDGDCYNLQGIKVANPTKGLYIRNGKKYIAK